MPSLVGFPNFSVNSAPNPLDVDVVYDVTDHCDNCRNGYSGRIAIQEVLLLDDDIRNAINNENISKDAKIIIYCRSGNRSKAAQERLNDMGYTNVYDMGGITNWPYDIV